MKFKSFFALAILSTATFLSGCSSTSDDLTSESVKQTIYLKLGNVQTKVSTKKDDSKLTSSNVITLTDGYIYFITSQDGIKDYYKIESTPTGSVTANGTKIVSLSSLTSGTSFSNVSGEVTKVYIVGNPNLGANEESLMTSPATFTNLKKQEIAIGTQDNASDLTVEGEANVVAANTSVFTSAAAGDKQAVVALSPLCSRIQIGQVTASGVISSYKLDGLFVNKFYGSMPLNSVPTTTINNFSSYPGDYSSFTTMYDYDAAGLGGSSLIKTPANGAWAYQFFVGEGSDQPRIILRMSSFSTSDGTSFTDPQYLNIRGFLDGSGNKITTLTRGYIYQIDNVSFKENNLSAIPDPADINLWVQVSVTPWVVQTVTPEL